MPRHDIQSLRFITPAARRALNKELTGTGAKDVVGRIGWLSGLHQKHEVLAAQWASRKLRDTSASAALRQVEHQAQALKAMGTRLDGVEAFFESRDATLRILVAALSDCVMASSDGDRLRIAREARRAVLEAGVALPPAGAPE